MSSSVIFQFWLQIKDKSQTILKTGQSRNSPISTLNSPRPAFSFCRQTLGVVKKTSPHQLSHCQFPDKGKVGPVQSVSDLTFPLLEQLLGESLKWTVRFWRLQTENEVASAQHNSVFLRDLLSCFLVFFKFQQQIVLTQNKFTLSEQMLK